LNGWVSTFSVTSSAGIITNSSGVRCTFAKILLSAALIEITEDVCCLVCVLLLENEREDALLKLDCLTRESRMRRFCWNLSISFSLFSISSVIHSLNSKMSRIFYSEYSMFFLCQMDNKY
jgi:hypothetical protein